MTNIELINKYYEMFNAPLPENVSDKKFFEIAKECIEKGKSAYELGYTDDNGAFGKEDSNGEKETFYY